MSALMDVIILILALISLELLSVAYNINLIRKEVTKYMKQVRVNEDTFDALLTIAEQAVAGQKASAEHVAALEAASANEENLDGARQARVDALTSASTSAPAPASPPVSAVPPTDSTPTQPS